MSETTEEIRALLDEEKQQDEEETIRGAGDLIARATKAFGISPCNKCEERRRALNKLFPRKR